MSPTTTHRTLFVYWLKTAEAAARSPHRLHERHFKKRSIWDCNSKEGFSNAQRTLYADDADVPAGFLLFGSGGGTTVTTFTPFADMDFAAQGYMDIVTAWEEETGNIVEDYSGLQDDLFLQQMTDMVSGGTADIVVVPVGSGLTGKQLVSVDELLAAAPDCGARKMTAMAESDGSILLTPVA